MNKNRRDRAEKIRNLLEEHKDALIEIVQDLTDLQGEEQEAFDNMSEGLQATETGQRIEAAAEALDTARSEVDELDSMLQTAMDQIDEAIGA